MTLISSHVWAGLGIALVAWGCGLSVKSTPTTPLPMTPILDISIPAASVADLAKAVSQDEPVTVGERLRQADQQLHVVLLRHALAPGTGDPPSFQLADCTTQRNLSDAGRQQARDIGQAFRQQGVEVDRVLSSQWCRCLETAELMEVGPVEPFAPLNSFFQDRRTADRQTAEVETYLRR